ncbi:MAG: C25 family peptidase propeptide domain-containing protein, partial [Bacteroidales bacterium]
MKKLFTFSVLFFLVFVLKAETIEKTWNIQAPMISNWDGFQIVNFENSMLTGRAGEPSLPYMAVKFLLPAGESATSIEFIGEDEIQLPGYFKLFPYQPSRPISEGKSGQFIMNDEIYSADLSYPKNSTGEIVTQYLNGYAIAMSSFTPVKYNPSTGTVSYFKKVKINVTTAPDSKSSAALQNLISNDYPINKISDFVQNTGFINSYPKKTKVSGYQMLIITPAQFETNFQ